MVWGIKKLNLALALDNTGSMASSGKMTALKEAAHNLLTTLKNAEKTPGDIKVSIVPFAVDVNVGTSNVEAPWIDWTDWEAANGTCSSSSYHKKSSCEFERQDLDAGRSQHLERLRQRPRPEQRRHEHRHGSRRAGHHVPRPSGLRLPGRHDDVVARLARAQQQGRRDDADRQHQCHDRHAGGVADTVAGGPFNAPAPSPDLEKVLVLLTDGDNTQNRWSSSQSAIDARTEKVCANAKADNIKVYTVRVIAGNATLLKNCATKPEMYYQVTQASQLHSVFASIAQNLANLRIAK